VVPHRRPGHDGHRRLRHITGRLKEIINRGGEKISPREVDEIMMGASRGCISASRSGCLTRCSAKKSRRQSYSSRGFLASDAELREFAKVKLADFKVPKKILILTEIPVGATGKLQRIGLAQKLGLG
jgi:acyl-CoA synthetase (AMP-forming)/AMP-acid ligase II